MSGLSGRDVIAISIKQGYTDEEIVESFGTRALVLDESEDLYLSEPPARRRLAAVIREIRAADPASAPSSSPGVILSSDAPRPDPTAEVVEAELARREAAGEPTSYGALAKHFGVHKSRIRRRLGVLK